MFQIIATVLFLLAGAPHGDAIPMQYRHAPFATESECTEFLATDTYKDAELSLSLNAAAEVPDDADGFKVTSACVKIADALKSE